MFARWCVRRHGKDGLWCWGVCSLAYWYCASVIPHDIPRTVSGPLLRKFLLSLKPPRETRPFVWCSVVHYSQRIGKFQVLKWVTYYYRLEWILHSGGLKNETFHQKIACSAFSSAPQSEVSHWAKRTLWPNNYLFINHPFDDLCRSSCCGWQWKPRGMKWRKYKYSENTAQSSQVGV